MYWRGSSGKGGVLTPEVMTRVWRLLTVLLVAFALLSSVKVHAQEPSAAVATLPDPLTPAAIDAMMSRLSDNDVRELLLQELGSRAEPTVAVEAPRKPLAEAIASPLRRVTEELQKAAAMSPEHAVAAKAAILAYAQSLGPGGGMKFVFVLVVVFLAGFAIDLAIGRRTSLRDSGRVVTAEDMPVFPASIPYLAKRLLGDAVGALLSLVVAAVIFVVLLPERETRVAMSVALWLFFFPRIAWIVLRFFLSPNRPSLRLVDADDRTAEVLFRSLMGVLIIVGLFQTIRLVMSEVNANESAQAVGFWINLLVFVGLALIVIRCRTGLQQIVQGGKDSLSRDDKWIVATYPAFALVAIFGTWIAAMVSDILGNEAVMQGGRHFLSLGLLLVTPMCDALIRATVRIFLPPMQGSGPAAQEAHDAVWRSYVRIARVVVFGTIIVVLAKLWGMTLVGLAAAGVGENLGERVVVSTLILMVGYILIEFVSLTINRKLANIKSDAIMAGTFQDEDHGPTSGGPSSRAGTILPPISWTLQAAIGAIAVVTALGHVGVNITALLAGAGVAGIAIGFGAQKLVADLVSGIFFLMNDAFRINEYIAAGSTEGTVEKISLQSMHLRKSDGAIHCVPYSSVDTITNFSRDWGTAKLVFTVPFDTDIERVRKIFKKIGQDLYNNPEYADAFLQPFKFKGVSQVTELGIVVRGKFMFKPEKAQQFMIKREIYNRVQADFAEAGITFARREVRVSVNSRDDFDNDSALEAASGAVIAHSPQT